MAAKKKDKSYSKGIYQKKGFYNVKVIGKGASGFDKDETVVQFTNNPNFGKGYFAMKGKYLDNFMKGYKKKPSTRKTTNKKKK